jgi:hypothetical protein
MKMPKFPDISNLLEATRDYLENKKNMSLQNVKKLKKSLILEFEKRISMFEKPRNLLIEAFEKRQYFKKFRLSVAKTLFPLHIRHVLSMPFIYGLIIPIVILDISVEIYQNICFRLYKIPLVKRREYILFDRNHLSYLNVIEKFHCAYCSYANGVFAFAREIAGRTEQYWCPIKHAKKRKDAHEYYDDFFEYLDGEGFRKKGEEKRKF